MSAIRGIFRNGRCIDCDQDIRVGCLGDCDFSAMRNGLETGSPYWCFAHGDWRVFVYTNAVEPSPSATEGKVF